MVQAIQGGNLLSSLANLLFKGLDKMFDANAEYEEEMGVLKQVTRIPLEDENGKETSYTLTIKLSPVKEKPGRFYVEAETTAPNLDVSSINEKVMKLNTNSKKSFLKMIDDLLEKNNLSESKKQNSVDKASSEKDSEDSTKDISISDEQEQAIADMIAQAAKSEGIEYRTAETEDKHVVTILTKLKQRDAVPYVCDVTISAEDALDHAPVSGVKNKSVMVWAITKSGQVLGFTQFCNAVKAEIDKFMKDNDLVERQTRSANSSSIVDATFTKDSRSNEISFTAIKASCNIKAALDLIETVASDDDFVSSLPIDSEQSYRIIDDGENIDIEEIAEVDVSPTYNVLFRQVSYLCSTLTAARWAIGEIEWNKLLPICSIDWALSDLLNSAASWVVRHEHKYPTPQNPYSDCDYADFSSCEDESGKLQPECLQTMLLADLDELVLLLDSYYVNLECDEQNVVANALSEFKRILTYA